MKKKNWTWSTLRPSFRCKHKQSFIDKFGLCSYYFFFRQRAASIRGFVRVFVRVRKLLFWYSSALSNITSWIQMALRFFSLAGQCHTQIFSLAEQCHTQIIMLGWAVPHSWIFDKKKMQTQPQKIKTTSKMKVNSKMKTT